VVAVKIYKKREASGSLIDPKPLLKVISSMLSVCDASAVPVLLVLTLT
jgi:hypothetical protein